MANDGSVIIDIEGDSSKFKVLSLVLAVLPLPP